MNNPRDTTVIKLAAFVVVMLVLTTFLFFVFGQYQTGTTNRYSAVFSDVSQLGSGQTVRVGGARVGTVRDVSLRPDKTVVVTFDADRSVVLTPGTRVAVRYLNLVGDRYLELVDGPGPTRVLPAGSQIPADHTAPALDLDLLLRGLKPVTRGLNAHDVNALTSAMVQIFQGQGGTLESLLSKTSSFSNALADNKEVVQQVVDNLDTVLSTIKREGRNFAGTVDRVERLVSELAAERDPIGAAIVALDNGTASLADLLTRARPPLSGTVDQLNRLAPLLDQDKGVVDAALQKIPANYRKMIRAGSYGATVNWFLCSLNWRVTDLQNRTVVARWWEQEGGRCVEPDA
ncbi:MAG TPA: MCE family protein [Mycobacterium sp.]|nr:MCE family protein [Mycobacterium sp.]